MKAVFLFLILIAAVSCVKDKRLERRLLKKEGKWNIISFGNTNYENDSITGDIKLTNYGFFIFKKNGKSVFWINEANSGEITDWTNTGNEIYIKSYSQSLRFEVLEQSRNKMELRNVQVSGDLKLVVTMSLEREK